MSILGIASAGGHLDELVSILLRRSDSSEVILATYNVAQARSALVGEEFIPTFHPTTKHVPNAARNYRLARRVFAEYPIHRVISTGAAVAVPFIVRAHQLRIPCHYIESATRVDGPSLSGRLLQSLPRVHLYRQLGTWGERRWQQGPCVFDGFETTPRETPAQLRRVVISLGTHGFAFTSLVARLAVALREAEVDCLWQLGATPDPGGLPGETVELLPPDDLAEAISQADVVIGHAGVGLTLAALRSNRVPVLVPRRRGRREHTDDHQVQLARALAVRSLAISAEVEDLSLEHLHLAASRRVIYRPPGPFTLRE